MSLFDDDSTTENFSLLFADEDGGNGGGEGSTSNKKGRATIQAPPSARQAAGLVGLLNQGATCYMNALVQTLFFSPLFRERLFALSTCLCQHAPSPAC